ncbi:MAG: hydrogenase iron-sulfur subunit [Candidatus Lokiarchaeota archaeon]|nr:hydrogenase iron-sulfur subunit [Candidatus Lokiarchaeota archaeon]MBD3337728.1 hydrogenase iron-sulfur subunit [Candidatus Lokiarchaeota archaeon]
MSESKNKKLDNEFEPEILVFCCNWCSYAGADLAGVSRFQYPPNIRIIRVMCSGRVQPTFILNAFKHGIDGVLVTGCHIGDCHYISGNEHAQVRMEHLKKLLKKIGINEDRFRLHWISASEGKQFAELITDFTDTIKSIGESPIPKKLGLIKFQTEKR